MKIALWCYGSTGMVGAVFIPPGEERTLMRGRRSKPVEKFKCNFGIHIHTQMKKKYKNVSGVAACVCFRYTGCPYSPGTVQIFLKI